MKWYFRLKGVHMHVRVFMNGANCGNLVFREEEFRVLLGLLRGRVLFFAEEEELTGAVPPDSPTASST